jgi:hypothetical protein
MIIDMKDNLINVSKEEFYRSVMPLDAVMKVVGRYPYTVEWRLRSGRLLGKSVGVNNRPTETKYYLA